MFIITAVNYFFQVLVYLILARAIMSWFIRSSNGTAYSIYMLIIRLTDPILEPCRNLLYRFGIGGTIDLSPILAIIGLQVIHSIVVRILLMIVF